MYVAMCIILSLYEYTCTMYECTYVGTEGLAFCDPVNDNVYKIYFCM